MFKKLLVYNPSNRISAKLALNHPYLRDTVILPLEECWGGTLARFGQFYVFFIFLFFLGEINRVTKRMKMDDDVFTHPQNVMKENKEIDDKENMLQNQIY